MKILLINQFFYPDESATSQFLTDLAEFLRKRGHQVDVICGRSKYASAAQKQDSALEGVGIHRVWGTDWHRKAGILGKAIDYLTFFVSAALKLGKMNKEDVVVTLSTPPLLGLLGIYARKMGHGCFIYWVQDIYPEIAQSLGVLKSKTLYLLLQSVAANIYRLADQVIVPGEFMAERLATRYCLGEKIHVIHHWPLFEPKNDVGSCRGRHGWQNDFVIMYSGNLGRAHDVRTFLEAFKIFSRKHDDGRLVVAGNGYRRKEVSAFARANPDLSIEMLDHQPRKELACFLGSPDLHIAAQLPQADGLVVPSKVYGILACGRPLCFIGSADNETAELLAKYDCGIRVEMGDAGGLAAKLDWLKREPAVRAKMGEAARRLAHGLFSRTNGLSKLANLIEETWKNE